jgi:hypothetical protein
MVVAPFILANTKGKGLMIIHVQGNETGTHHTCAHMAETRQQKDFSTNAHTPHALQGSKTATSKGHFGNKESAD